jgi:hypothetical protein
MELVNPRASTSTPITATTNYHEIEASTSASFPQTRFHNPLGLNRISTTFVFNSFLLIFLLLTSTLTGAQPAAGDQPDQNGRTRVSLDLQTDMSLP